MFSKSETYPVLQFHRVSMKWGAVTMFSKSETYPVLQFHTDIVSMKWGAVTMFSRVRLTLSFSSIEFL